MALKKDDVVTVSIDDIGITGEGIGKADGYTLFVKDTVIGDVAQIKVIKAKKNYGYGRLLKLVEKSKDRVEPKCPVARQCGGCQIQQMSYKSQLDFKEKLVRDNLTRIGRIQDDYEMLPIIGMEEPFYYRNKSQYPVGRDKNGKITIGFYAGRTHCIVDNDDCCIGAPINKTIIELIRKYMYENNIAPYDEITHTGVVRHILIRQGFHTNEIMVCIIIKGKELRNFNRLVEALTTVDNMTSIMININNDRTNVILGSECKALWGRPYIEDYIDNIKYQISPHSFFQVNPQQTEKLYKKALEFADLHGNEVVWDLYCGIGTISLFLAAKAKKVYGVEIVPQAIEDARNNARINNINNVEFFVGKSEEVVPRFYEEAVGTGKYNNKDNNKDNNNDNNQGEKGIHPDVIVVDPPRKGCEEVLLDTMVKMQPARIVYVSCDSATLARDLKFLSNRGYKVVKVQPVDQFAHSVHVETVVLMSKVNTPKG